MSESKQVQEKWRSEEQRAERKARLARMKSKDGGKKPIRKRNTLALVIAIVVLVIALLATGVWAAVRLGVPQRTFAAATVGSVKVKAVELTYYFRSILNYYGIDPTTDEGKTTLNGDSGVEGFATVKEWLIDSAAQQAQEYIMLEDLGIKAGLSLDDEDQKTITSALSSLSSTAQQDGSNSDAYLAKTYGAGMNTAIYKDLIERYLMADKFTTYKKDSLTYTADQLKEYYEKNKADFDVASYRSFYIASDAATDATDDQKATALKAAKAKAEEMLAKITDEASFKAQCIAYASTADKESYQTTDKSLSKQAYKSSMSTDQAAWCFDDARKAGDKTIIETTSGYYVMYFNSRSKADFKHINVRHILISAAEDSATEAEIAEAKKKAESILAEYNAGAKTEDAFAELAKTNSADGNAAEGGLYENVAPGTMVTTFNDWCYDSARKVGDTGIVQTEYGFHIMYFSGFTDKADWEYKVEDTLRSNDYDSFIEKEKNNTYPYKLESFGMNFVS